MDLCTKLSLRIDRLHLLHRARIRKELTGLDVFCGQMPFLNYLLDHENCTQATIAEALGLSAATVAISAKRLCRAGLVEKVSDESDLRRNLLRITESGKARVLLSREKAHLVDREMFSGFTDKEMEEFRAYLDRIILNLGGKEQDFLPEDNYILAQKLHGKAKK